MRPSRGAMWGLLAGLGFVAGVIVACGGGGSSTSGPSTGGCGGGSAGATIQGQIVRSQSAALKESTVIVVLHTALGIRADCPRLAARLDACMATTARWSSGGSCCANGPMFGGRKHAHLG